MSVHLLFQFIQNVVSVGWQVLEALPEGSHGLERFGQDLVYLVIPFGLHRLDILHTVTSHRHLLPTLLTTKNILIRYDVHHKHSILI